MDTEAAMLEVIIDKIGLGNTLATLSTVCHEKAEHIESNWQDPTLAKQWTKAGQFLNTITRKTVIDAVSPL